MLPPGRDQELLERVQRGDLQALRALYDAWSSRAMAIALRLLRDRAEAEDVVQETFLEIWKRSAEYQSQRGAPGAWIVTIARSRAIDRLRSRDSAARTVQASAQLDEPAPLAPIELVEQRQNRDRIASALRALPEEQRAVIELAYFNGLSQREIAERTGDPLGTVKTRVRLALEKLTHLLRGSEEAVP